MFGFSLQKLLVLVAVVAAVWYGFKLIGRLDARRKAEARRHGGDKTLGGRFRRGRAAPPAPGEAEDLVACPTCRAYVAARNPARCERGDCPY